MIMHNKPEPLNSKSSYSFLIYSYIIFRSPIASIALPELSTVRARCRPRHAPMVPYFQSLHFKFPTQRQDGEPLRGCALVCPGAPDAPDRKSSESERCCGIASLGKVHKRNSLRAANQWRVENKKKIQDGSLWSMEV